MYNASYTGSRLQGTDCVRTLVSPRELRTNGANWIVLDPPACDLASGKAPDVSHDHLPRDYYVSLGAWKHALHYIVQLENTKMYGIQITTINNHKPKLMHNMTHKICPLREHLQCNAQLHLCMGSFLIIRNCEMCSDIFHPDSHIATFQCVCYHEWCLIIKSP